MFGMLKGPEGQIHGTVCKPGPSTQFTHVLPRARQDRVLPVVLEAGLDGSPGCKLCQDLQKF